MKLKNVSYSTLKMQYLESKPLKTPCQPLKVNI